MYSNKIPLKIHVELTDKCNAVCIQCSRNKLDKNTKEIKARPDLLLTELTLKDFKFMFDGIEEVMDTGSQPPVAGVTFCGNFGDPVAAKESLQIYEYLLNDLGVNFIHVHTNGALRPKWYWEKLGKLFSTRFKKDRSGCVVTFALDGLEDTHHLYRVNTTYKKVIENAKTYIAAGGPAEWSLIGFGHNEHQIEEARQRASDLGFISFNYTKTHRFQNKDHIDYIFKGKEYRITAPTKDKRVTSGKKKYEKTEPTETKIDCIVKKRNEIFIGADGVVDACCWMGSSSYYVNHLGARYKSGDVYNFLHFEKEDLNIKEIPLKDIVFSQYFKKTLPASWELQPCNTCTRVCGVDYRTYRDREQLQS